MPLHVDYELTIEQLPQECVDDCGKGGGAKDEAVEYWRNKLGFTVDRTHAINCLAGYGAWEREELGAMCDEDIGDKVLWLACSDFAEYQVGGNSAGSDVFVLE